MAASKFDVDEFLGEELTVDNLRELVKAELKIVAQSLNVDITGCSRKAEILDAIVTHAGLTQQAAAAALNDTNTAKNESNPMSEINLEKARVELQERKDRLKANEHEREMERKRLAFEIMQFEDSPRQEHRVVMANQWGRNLQQG